MGVKVLAMVTKGSLLAHMVVRHDQYHGQIGSNDPLDTRHRAAPKLQTNWIRTARNLQVVCSFVRYAAAKAPMDGQIFVSSR